MSIISAVFVKIARLYVKNCAIMPPPPTPLVHLPSKTKGINTSIFPNFSPISRRSLAFHFTLRFSLFIDETAVGGAGWRREAITDRK